MQFITTNHNKLTTVKLLDLRLICFLLDPLFGVLLFIFISVQLADQFCNAIGVLQQCAPPASFSNIQTAINKDQPANPTEGNLLVFILNLSNHPDISLLIHQSKTQTHSLFLFLRITASSLQTFQILLEYMWWHLSFHLEYAQLFATLIARTAKDVDVLIDSLPSEESTSALQVMRVGVAFNNRFHWFSF